MDPAYKNLSLRIYRDDSRGSTERNLLAVPEEEGFQAVSHDLDGILQKLNRLESKLQGDEDHNIQTVQLPIVNHLAESSSVVKKSFPERTIPSYLQDRKSVPQFSDLGLGRRFLHHIVPNTAAVRRHLVKYGITTSRNLHDSHGFVASIHDNHIHVVHGCTYSHNRCQCDRYFVPPGCGRYQRASIATTSVDRLKLDHLWEYLVEPGRRTLLFWRNSYGLHPIYVSNRVLLNFGRQETSEMDFDGRECEDGSLPGFQAFLETEPELPPVLATKQPEWEWMAQQGEQEWISEPNKILALPSVVEKHKRLIVSKKEVLLKNLMAHRSILVQKYRNYRFADFAQDLASKRPSFGLDPSTVQDRERTVKALRIWLEHNFACDWPVTFLKLIDVFDKRTGKINSVVLVGPPGSGKTWFWSMFTQIALFVGRPVNWNRNERFSFDSCVDKVLLFHDECLFPSGAPDYVETYKMLAAGSTCTVQVKHRPAAEIERTPLFIASNYHPLQECAHLKVFFDNERWLIYNVTVPPRFQHYLDGKLPNPLALFEIYYEALKRSACL